MATVILDSVNSTNTWAKEHAPQLHHGDVVLTHCQIAGRGQRGNTWEAEPGKNLTFSMLLRPEAIAPARQFSLSEIVALAVADTLMQLLDPDVDSSRIKVKWPNDIYVDDRKIAGILIEHTISGSAISHTVTGIGLNVNQRVFRSDAPNPVSMFQLSGHEFPLDQTLGLIRDAILAMIAECDFNAIHRRFLAALWRNDGAIHPFALPDGSRFSAAIDNVTPEGMLALRRTDGATAAYAFKEVVFLLS